MVPRDERNRLSHRETEVLRLAASGLTDQQIANSLGIRVSTVSTYWIRIRSKVGLLTRAELAAQYATRQTQRSLSETESELEEARTEIQGLRERLEECGLASAAVEALPFPVVVARRDGLISLANRSAQSLFRLDYHQLSSLRLVRTRRLDGENHSITFGFEGKGQAEIVGSVRDLDQEHLLISFAPEQRLGADEPEPSLANSRQLI